MKDDGWGIRFDDQSPESLTRAIERAKELYENPGAMQAKGNGIRLLLG
ncbi:MAG: hypothetical protein QGH39_07480 [Candidatus Thermoplasmatota archaeon]|nr:hypothetical protein [Candidatus Thermoplasmatota archaeon]MDP7265387.1 hypothetical protein [Candidatus Thermoplasmatota archaeon]